MVDQGGAGLASPADIDRIVEKLPPKERAEFLRIAEEVLEEEERDRARRSHLEFIKYCWPKPSDDPFIVGYHTRRICERIDRAIQDYREGRSTFLRIAVHNRAGKSEIVSHFLPAHFIGEFPRAGVILTSYNHNKATEQARKGHLLVRSRKYASLYPDTKLSGRASGVRDWMITHKGEEVEGRVLSSSLYSGLTGAGYSLGIIDDYASGRAAAESARSRDAMWEAFKDDMMTRRGPVSITIILATQWHIDDLHGRIARKNDPEDEGYDPEFPRFDYLGFPARAKDNPHPEPYPGRYLFMERYSEGWYEEQYATLGPYSAAAILDCNPTRRGGNILPIDTIVTHPTADELPEELQWYRVWDYAHSAKQRVGDDPDYTGGTLLAFRKKGVHPELREPIIELWVRDYIEFRESAPKRDAEIMRVTKQDGPKVRVLVENSLDSIDAAAILQAKLQGVRSVTAVNCPGDKVVRATPLEPIFEAGRVHILRGAWNARWKQVIEQFDGTGKSHDEAIDNLSCGYKHLFARRGYKALRDTFS